MYTRNGCPLRRRFKIILNLRLETISPPPHPLPPVSGGLSARMQLNIPAYKLIIPLLFFLRPTSIILFASHLSSSFLSSARLCSSPRLISPHFISVHLTSTHLTLSHLTSSCLSSLRFQFPSPSILFSSFLSFPLRFSFFLLSFPPLTLPSPKIYSPRLVSPRLASQHHTTPHSGAARHLQWGGGGTHRRTNRGTEWAAAPPTLRVGGNAPQL